VVESVAVRLEEAGLAHGLVGGGWWVVGGGWWVVGGGWWVA
jgi:hypothetical protein